MFRLMNLYSLFVHIEHNGDESLNPYPANVDNRVSIPIYISNKTQRYTVYSCLETALHVSVGTCTHHQVRIQLYLQNLVFVTPLLISGVRHPQHTQTGSNSSTIAADISKGVTNTRCCRYSCMRS
jgi:hypothetical protein